MTLLEGAVATDRDKRPTQADVARLAAVSQAVVSHVLRGSAGIAIAPETRRRVLDAIASLGYVPDRAARSLRSGKTLTIAGVIPDITNPFYPAFERGVQDVAEGHGYDLIVYNTDGDPDKEARCLGTLLDGRVDGVVAVFFHLGVRHLRPLLERQVPVVRLEAAPKPTGPLPLDNLYVDNAAAAHAAVAYLLERGHTRIGMIAGHGGPASARLAGYRRALAERNVAVDEDLVRVSRFTADGGHIAMGDLLTRTPRPTAVFAANDLMAIGVLVALREAGLRVPDDVAVVGFDDLPIARLFEPPLTTMAQFPERLGRRAAELLFERLSTAVPAGGRCEEMPYELIVRRSA
ncbi:MAG: LacI family DNA-binding transcriptional regulator [Chloroflexia bacterium]|nr:LacI family DNA-binding transcriptional regulator [Chloroflexia bacterium]